jgi:hypothetical protein
LTVQQPQTALAPRWMALQGLLWMVASIHPLFMTPKV